MLSRTIAIGDIHGCSKALAALIEAVDPGPEDLFVTLGDYIDRGPDSRGVLDLLIDLSRRCRLVPLLGNHDQVLLDVRAKRCPVSLLLGIGGIATLDSYAPGRELAAIPAEHLAFLEDCLDFYETGSHIFIHANYDPDLAMEAQSESMLRWESLRDTTPGPHRSGKTVVVGHTSQKNGKILDLGHLVCIDTFCYGGGWLTALDVTTRQTWQVNRYGALRRGDRPANLRSADERT